MGRALIQTVNTSPQVVGDNGIISPGSALRRYGCNCRLNGNAIEIEGMGYYDVSAIVTVQAAAAGEVTVALYENGMPVSGAEATATAAAIDDYVVLPIVTTLRQYCNCEGASAITAVLTEGGGSTITNISLRIAKE